MMALGTAAATAVGLGSPALAGQVSAQPRVGGMYEVTFKIAKLPPGDDQSLIGFTYTDHDTFSPHCDYAQACKTTWVDPPGYTNVLTPRGRRYTGRKTFVGNCYDSDGNVTTVDGVRYRELDRFVVKATNSSGVATDFTGGFTEHAKRIGAGKNDPNCEPDGLIKVNVSKVLRTGGNPGTAKAAPALGARRAANALH